eukprot:UN25154
MNVVPKVGGGKMCTGKKSNRQLPTPLFAFYTHYTPFHTHYTPFHTHSTFCVLYHSTPCIPTPLFQIALIFYSHQFSIKILLVCESKTFSMYDVVMPNANNSC